MRTVWLLIAINVAVSVALGCGPAPPWAMRASDVLDGRVWQLWTYTFLHLDISHLAKNMIVLLVFGAIVARAAGWTAFLLLYTACGLAASATFVSLSVLGFTSPFAPCLGASGCILGLVGAAAVLPTDRRIWLGPVTAPLWVGAVAVAAYYIWSISAGDRGGDIFHLSGMVAGAGLSVAIRRTLSQQIR